MKKILAMFVLSVLAAPSITKAESAANPFVYTSGKLSAGIVEGDVYQSWDIFKRAGNVNARTGGSLTFLSYDRFGLFVGAAAPSSDPSAVSVDFGPQINLDDVSKAAISKMIEVLPFKIEAGTTEAIAQAFTLKLKWGYDFRQKGSGVGVGFGIKKVF